MKRSRSHLSPFLHASTSVSDKNVESAPTGFAMHQNCPNPFNVATAISYELARLEEVVMKIYNLSGQEIATLVHGFKQRERKR